MKIAVADADPYTVAILDYAFARDNHDMYPVKTLQDIIDEPPQVIFIERSHRLLRSLADLRMWVSPPPIVVVLDPQHGFCPVPPADQYLPKPFTAAQLKQVMARICAA